MKLLPSFLLILILICPLQQIPDNRKPTAGKELQEFFPGGEIQLFQVIPFYRKTTPEDEAEISFIENSGVIHSRDAAAEIRANQQLRKASPGPELHLKFTNKAGYTLVQEKAQLIFRPQDKNLPVINLDLNKKKLIIAGETLDYNDPIEVKSTDNVFHSAWEGYSWQNDNVKLCLGRLQQGGQLFLQIRLLGRDNDLLFMQRKVSRT